MPYIYIKDFSAGLDTRRLPVNTPAGALLELVDAHIDRGGEIENRKAFVPTYDLPVGTVGLAAAPLSLYVFGSGPQPDGLPGGLRYQQLQHHDGATPLIRLLSYDLFAGKIYAVGLFADASILHFYDGVRVANWFDGRAKASFTITGGLAGAHAAGLFRVVSGAPGGVLTDLTVGGASVIGAPVDFGVDVAATADAIAATISATSTVFRAFAEAGTVTVSTVVAGTDHNGALIVPFVSGPLVIAVDAQLAGGAAPGKIAGITIDGVEVTDGPVNVAATPEDTAAAVAVSVNKALSAPDYGATARANTVILTAATEGTAANGRAVNLARTGDVTLEPGGGVVMSGGADPAIGADLATARATFRVVAGGPSSEAVGSFEIDSGDGGATLDTLTVNGVQVTSGPMTFTGDMNESAIAEAIEANINGHTSSPDYTAVAEGSKLTLTSVQAGASGNGTFGRAGTLSFSRVDNPVGGDDGGRLRGLTVNGASVIGGLLDWAGTPEDMAAAIAAAVNGFSSAPDYTASAAGAFVTLSAPAGGAANGLVVRYQKGPGLVLDPETGPAFAGGSDDVIGTFQPGAYVRTIKTKEYSTSRSNLHFSGAGQPTQWETETTGAGFINMSAQASGSEDLTAIAPYRNNAAIFAARTIQVWFLDVDPAQSQQIQVLENTGTTAPRSVTTFGDADIFYLDDSGIRSLRARDTTNAAFASDIGNAIDTLVKDLGKTVGAAVRDQAIGLVEPSDGRFWLIVGDRVFVFSFFANSKISAWSSYSLGFMVDYAAVFQKRAYLRSGDRIYLYGGPDGDTYDDTTPVVRVPYLDAGKPGTVKQFLGIDVSCTGTWDVWVGLDPNDLDVLDNLCTVTESTFTLDKIGGYGSSTHCSFRFVGRGREPQKLGSVLLHYAEDYGGES